MGGTVLVPPQGVLEMNKKALVAIAACMLMTVAAFAQGGPPGGGGRGQGGMRMMGGGNSILGLLGRTDVQTDIGATAEQKTAIQALQAKQREAMQAMMEEMRNGGGGGMEEMRTKMQENQAKWDKEALALITPEQGARVKQIRIQLSGNSAILDKEVQKALGMTEAQIEAVKTAQNKQQEDQRDLFERMQNGELERTEMQPAMQKITENFNKALGDILTVEQKAKLVEMGGKKFTPTQQGRGGGGGF